MKLRKLFRSVIGVAMLCPFATAVTASAYDLQVSQGENGVYWGTTPEGFQIGCEVNATQQWSEDRGYYYDDFYVWVSNFKVYNDTFTLPESVTVIAASEDIQNLVGQQFQITRLGNYDYGVNWYDSENYSIIVPECYTDMGDMRYPKNVTFRSSDPPTLHSGLLGTCYVPKSAIAKYRQYCKNELQGWSEDINLLPENGRDSSHDVYVPVEGTLEDELLKLLTSQNEEFEDVYNLTVTGNINGRDLNVMAKLRYLNTLDLSATGIEKMRDCANRAFLKTVKLPNTVKEIEPSAFNNCQALESINLANVEKIGDNAFYYCQVLESINLDKAEEIGHQAFYACSALRLVTGEKVKSIHSSAFGFCISLESIDFPNVTSINSYAFSNCGLKEFHIYDNVSYDNSCINDSKVERLYFHTNRNFNRVLGLPYLTDVYLYDPIPGNIVRDDTQAVIPRLHVPGFSYDSYIDHPNYYGFDKVLILDENLTSLTVYDDLTISSNEGLTDKFDLTLTDYQPYYDEYNTPALVNNASNPLIVGDFVQYYELKSNWDGYNSVYRPSTTFINNGTITADNVTVKISLKNSKDIYNENGWNFISFPYDVKVRDIVTPKEALWVVREYDGNIRANRTETGDNSQTESAWVNVKDAEDTILEAGKGYILHFSSNNGGEFTFPAADSDKKNNIFSSDDVSVPLNYYSSTYPHNASWNLIGNPYDACFDIRQITDSNSPSQVITVWRSSDKYYEDGYERYGTYEAFSLVDDDYVLAPFEAFFMQATGADTSVTFHKEGRQHTFYEKDHQHHAPRRMVASNPDRAIINLHISGNGFSDRTRLVINEEASTDYEISCDASKFFSTDENVPQIFMVQDGQPLAINERPMGTGMFRVGTKFGVDGDYTITSDSRNSEYSLILYDAETGIETDITESGYAFNANAGSCNNRFSLRLVASESGVSNVVDNNFNVMLNDGILSVMADGEINVFSIDGTLVAAGSDNLETAVSKGIYVVKGAGKTMKVTY